MMNYEAKLLRVLCEFHLATENNIVFVAFFLLFLDKS